MEGGAHGGMLTAAQRLWAEIQGVVLDALRANPGYALVLCGHSLGAGLATLMGSIIGPAVAVPGAGRAAAAEAPVRVYAFAPPCVLSLELARAATHVMSVVLGADMVPRFGMATTMDLRESLAALHRERETGLAEEIESRRATHEQASGSSSGGGFGGLGEADARWARSVLARLSQAVPPTRKLFPGGTIWWSPVAGAGAGAGGPPPCVVDQNAFQSLVLCGSEMFSSHMPQTYARVLLGSTQVYPA